MKIAKRQPLLFGALLITALSILALLLVSPNDVPVASGLSKQLPKPAKPRLNSATEASVVKKQAQPFGEANQVIASTPLTHDQLVVSTILEGTDIDGSLKAAADGSLILDLGVRDFFDYFLSIADDVGADVAISEIQRYAQSYLPEPARSQAMNLLQGYLRYKKAEFEIQQNPITQSIVNDSDALALLKQSFEQLKAKRQSLFSPAQDQALFGLEDSYANHTLASLALMADEKTSDEQKRQQLEVLESRLPAELSASFALTDRDRQRQKTIEAAVGSDRDDAQLYQQLEQNGIDREQIDLIVSRRQQQRQFELNYQQYQTAKQLLSEELDVASALYQSELNRLQNHLFTSPEDLTLAKLRDLQQD